VNNLTGNSKHSDADLLSEVQLVVQSEAHKLRNELQMEHVAEVLENIKYETAQTSWIDRLPAKGATFTVATAHPQCETVTGNLLLVNDLAVVLTTAADNFIFFNSHITWVTGLQVKSQVRNKNPLDPFGLQLLLQDLVDQQNIDTWFISGGRILTGILVRLFRDSVELVVDRKSVFLMIDQIVAVRSKCCAI
jgi:hypothetical protein